MSGVSSVCRMGGSGGDGRSRSSGCGGTGMP